jgi:uncharacterized protein
LVKRLRHTSRVTVAPCGVRSGVKGPAVDGGATFVEHADWPQALAALRRTYGVRFTLGHHTSRLWHKLLRRPGERHELLRIRPA